MKKLAAVLMLAALATFMVPALASANWYYWWGIQGTWEMSASGSCLHSSENYIPGANGWWTSPPGSKVYAGTTVSNGTWIFKNGEGTFSQTIYATILPGGEPSIPMAVVERDHRPGNRPQGHLVRRRPQVPLATDKYHALNVFASYVHSRADQAENQSDNTVHLRKLGQYAPNQQPHDYPGDNFIESTILESLGTHLLPELFDLGEGSFASVVDGLEGLVRSRAHRLADAVRTLGRQRTREGRKEEENDKSGGGETAPHGMG